jgi:hypothetical protein
VTSTVRLCVEAAYHICPSGHSWATICSVRLLSGPNINGVPFSADSGGNNTGYKPREDTIAMIKQYPLMNAYWADKHAKAHLIDVPAYVLASMSTGLHTVGSTRCFEDIPQQKKWCVARTLFPAGIDHLSTSGICCFPVLQRTNRPSKN